jgi:hypothetical protein
MGMNPPSLEWASLEISKTVGLWGRKIKTNGKADCKFMATPAGVIQAQTHT